MVGWTQPDTSAPSSRICRPPPLAAGAPCPGTPSWRRTSGICMQQPGPRDRGRPGCPQVRAPRAEPCAGHCPRAPLQLAACRPQRPSREAALPGPPSSIPTPDGSPSPAVNCFGRAATRWTLRRRGRVQGDATTAVGLLGPGPKPPPSHPHGTLARVVGDLGYGVGTPTTRIHSAGLFIDPSSLKQVFRGWSLPIWQSCKGSPTRDSAQGLWHGRCQPGSKLQGINNLYCVPNLRVICTKISLHTASVPEQFKSMRS